jgi:hypothetical protein
MYERREKTKKNKELHSKALEGVLLSLLVRVEYGFQVFDKVPLAQKLSSVLSVVTADRRWRSYDSMGRKTGKPVQETRQPCRVYDHGSGRRTDLVRCDETIRHSCRAKRSIGCDVLVHKYTDKTW